MIKQKLSKILSMETAKPEDEWVILSYSIMSSEILGFIHRKYKSGQIKTKHFGQYFQPLFRWLMIYYGNYEKAPERTIQEVFNSYGKSLKEETREIIEDYLERIAEEYISFQDSGINPDFIKKEIVPRFIRKQEAELLVQNIQSKIQTDHIEEIDNLISGYSIVSDEEEDPDFGTVKPGSVRAVKKYYGEEKDKGALFKLPGAIGDFLGPIYRGKLYALTGIEKSGKTYFSQEIGYHAVFQHKLKVLDVNLEMPVEDKQERFWQRLGNYAVDEDHAGKLIVPVFDCENNQFGTCEVRQRKLNQKDLLSSMDDEVYFEERRAWRVCQKCRYEKQRLNVKRTKKFIPAIWFKEVKIKQLTEKRILNTVKEHLPFGITNYRIKCFPRFSATLSDIITYIKAYVVKKNFHPDIIIIDYPDITRPINGELMDRFNIDFNWKTAAGLSQEMNCAVFAPDQAVKAARNKRSLGVMDTSEAKTKDAHLDMRLTLNSTDDEKEIGLQRIGMLFRRKGRLLQNEVMLTQRLETGNVILDSEWWNNFNTHYPTKPRRKE